MDVVLQNANEPQWLENPVIGSLRVWQLIFLCFASVISVIVMVCCCFRFRIPRTKQQIEADYQRRKITSKFRQQLETIQDSKMDDMSLKDVDYLSVITTLLCTLQALELLHEKKKMEDEKQEESRSSCNMSPQQSSFDVTPQPAGGQKPEPQVAGQGFVKFATKVAHLSKLGSKPASPSPSATKMDF